jgi:hypothetical protein
MQLPCFAREVVSGRNSHEKYAFRDVNMSLMHIFKKTFAKETSPERSPTKLKACVRTEITISDTGASGCYGSCSVCEVGADAESCGEDCSTVVPGLEIVSICGGVQSGG